MRRGWLAVGAVIRAACIDFVHLDQHGDALTRHRLLGQWTFVLFGDTHCATPCTHRLSALSARRARIARAQVVHSTQLLFVSLDPVRDDATRLKTYLTPTCAC